MYIQLTKRINKHLILLVIPYIIAAIFMIFFIIQANALDGQKKQLHQLRDRVDGLESQVNDLQNDVSDLQVKVSNLEDKQTMMKIWR